MLRWLPLAQFSPGRGLKGCNRRGICYSRVNFLNGTACSQFVPDKQVISE